MAIYYLSPSGNDTTGNGSIDSPWFTLEKVWTVISAGDIVYMRGGTYEYTTQQDLNGKNGTSGNLIKIWAYPREFPIIQGTNFVFDINSDQDLISFTGNYIHFKGLEIANFAQKPDQTPWFAFRSSDMSYCIVENIKYHDNGAAFTVRGNGTGNLFLNSDFYRNQDPYSDTPYDGADGLAITYNDNVDSVNIVRNCRAWWNADDGFDTWMNRGYVEFDNCISFYNGYQPGSFLTAGNGSGFKLGTAYHNSFPGYESTTDVKRYVHNCLAWKNRSWGIVENQNACNMTIVNNTSSNNGGLNYWFGVWDASPKTFRNNISYIRYYVGDLGATGEAFGGDAVHSNNTWDSAVTLSTADFLSEDDSVLDNDRLSDSTLPENIFLKLANGSDLKNSGTNVGLPYFGTAPDMGFVESTGNTYFLSPTGNDTTGNGSLTSPWFMLNKAWIGITAGDTIYMRGGTYTYNTQQYLTNNTGATGNLIKIRSYPGEYAAVTRGVTFSKPNYPNGMVFMDANYIHIYRIRFTGMYTDDNQVDAGLFMENSSYCLFEFLECDNNVEGFYIQNDYTGNLWLNCDFHDNYSNYLIGGDPGNPSGGGDSDGLGLSYSTLTAGNNIVRNCRAWNNGDDGFDSFQSFGFITYENCWSWHNGFIYGTTALDKGNGVGFKLGSSFPLGTLTGQYKRLLTNCIAWDNGTDASTNGGGRGYHSNEADWVCKLYNCVAYKNGQSGLNFDAENQPHVFKNVISFDSMASIEVEIGSNSTSSNCSYGGGSSNAVSGWTNNVSEADFITVDWTGASGPRFSNGDLPELNFLRLAPGSDMIDTGVDVGLPYSGSAPDRGAFEYGYIVTVQSNSSPTSNAGSDVTIYVPTSTIELSGSGSDTDGTIVSYLWTQTSGLTATIVSPTASITSVTGLTVSGIRTFVLTVTDNEGATGSDSVTVYVNQLSTSNMTAVMRRMAGIISGSRNVTSTPINLTFTELDNWQEISSGKWCLVSSGSNGGGKCTKYLPSGGNGYIQCDVTDDAGDINNYNAGVGFALSNSLTMDYSYDYLLYIEGANGNYKTYDNSAGYVDTGVPAASGDKLKIERISNTMYASYYRGGSWIPLYTYPITTTANLYIYGSSYDIGPIQYVVNPKGFGLL